MKKPQYILPVIVSVVALAVVASCFIPAFPTRAKRHGTRIQSVNSVSSVSFTIGTNGVAIRQTENR